MDFTHLANVGAGPKKSMWDMFRNLPQFAAISDRLNRMEIKFFKACNPWGLEDLIGAVWQYTNNQYYDGPNQLLILKG